MHGLRIERMAQAQLAARSMGRDIRQPRLHQGQMRADGYEAEVRAMPVIPATQDLQAADGTFYFVAGVSTLDSGDVLG
jgi:hypothetical protein